MKQEKINRRNFIKTIGAAGLGSVLASTNANAEQKAVLGTPYGEKIQPQKPIYPQVPKRTLGKTKVEVSALSFGLMFNTIENQIILRKALQWGITYWDTADCYVGGNSELGVGKFFAKNPDARKQVFLVTKSDKRDPDGIQELLERSLSRMKTNHIDLYFLHSVKDPGELTEDIKKWVQKVKQQKKIKFFGFSTHKNMAKCLNAAAKLDWIDAIMTSYNFRLMQDEKMNAAVDACHKAGIGLTAMKVQAGEQKVETDGDKKLTRHFIQKGFTEGQAKIKAVLQSSGLLTEDKRFATACLSMQNVALMTSNAAAVLDKTKLTKTDLDVFTEYAQKTCDGYCAGCAEICDLATAHNYTSNIMRYLMYYNSYGDHERAKLLFAKIPNNVKNRLLATDYSTAQARCPQKLSIAKLIAQAVQKLA